MQTDKRGFSKVLSKRRRGLLYGGVVIVLLVVIGKLFLFSPLPRGAYPILSTAGWGGQLRGSRPPIWLPNGDLAFLQNDSKGMSQICYRQMDVKGSTGPVRRGPELPINNWQNVFFPSPDAQWVAYMQFTPPNKFQTFVLSAEGKTTRQGGEYFSGWLGDSRSYICRSPQGTTTKVYHVDSPRAETIPGIAPWDTPTLLTMCSTGTSFLIGSSLNNPVQNSGMPQNYSSMTLRSFLVANPTTIERKWQATIPQDMNFGAVSASPDTKYLLWTAIKLSNSPWVKWLNLLNPHGNKNPTFELHYFLSDLNGNHVHPALANFMGGTVNLNPSWAPDSKHINFFYQGQIYLVPID